MLFIDQCINFDHREKKMNVSTMESISHYFHRRILIMRQSRPMTRLRSTTIAESASDKSMPYCPKCNHNEGNIILWIHCDCRPPKRDSESWREKIMSAQETNALANQSQLLPFKYITQSQTLIIPMLQ